MAEKNMIQFQKGLSLQEFLSQFGTEEQCRSRMFQSNRCHFQVSLASGTIFAYTKLPLTVWFLAIYVITQSKVRIAALSLSMTIGVSCNTALWMKCSGSDPI